MHTWSLLVTMLIIIKAALFMLLGAWVFPEITVFCSPVILLVAQVVLYMVTVRHQWIS